MGRSKNQRKPRIVDHVSDDSDDEEIPEDEAFNSDEERKYGSFFKKKDGVDTDEESHDESDSEIASGSEDDDDDDDDEGDGGQYMLELLEKMDQQGDDRKLSSSDSAGLTSHMKESEFSSSVVGQAGLTLDSLMQGLEDTKGFGVMQKQMKKVAQGSATAAPVAKVVSDRAKRKVHYEDQSKEVSHWIPAVQQNRQAETLDFRPKERMEVTRELLVEKFMPTTDFEKQLQAALQEAGQQDEEAFLKAEEDALRDDLGANEVSMDEYKKRRGQLAKMRALMFYHEQKQHHIKKIKSKKYRRIRKRQRERQKEADLEAQVEENPDLARELEEKEEVERMKERASLAHKNTSKWAKRVLKRGKNVDIDTRRALSAQLKRGDDLLKRMKTTRAAEDDENTDDEDPIELAQKVLSEEGNDVEGAVQGKGLFKLSFMQRGIERQRQEAREEARQLLRELEDDEDDGSTKDGEKSAPPAKRLKPASKAEMTSVLAKDELVATALKFGKSTSISVSGEIDVGTKSQTVSVHESDISAADTSKVSGRVDQPAKHPNRPKQQVAAEGVSPHDANPWLEATEEAANTLDSKVKKSVSSAKRTGIVDVDRAVDMLDPILGERSTGPAGDGHDGDAKIATLTQEQLVQRAFATESANEAEAEFEKEKLALEEEEDPNRKKKKEKNMEAVSGWGSWAGKGAPPPPPPRKVPKKLQAPEKKVAKRKRADEKKPGVIITEKRMKHMANNYMIAEIPYPYSSREEYERAMAGGVGREWNVTKSFKEMTRPEIITRAGKVIQPISKQAKQRRAAAKF